ncbi:MAG: tetratricopeptide repeat protein [Bdellovibrionia bacterium]
MKSIIFSAFLLISIPFCSLGWAENSEPAPIPQLPSPNGLPLDEYAEGKQLMHDRKWVEAVVLLRSALKKNPRSTTIETDLARALAYSGRREEALAVLSQMINRKRGAGQKELLGRQALVARYALVQRARVLSRLFLTNTTFQVHQDGVNLVLSGKYRAAREKFEKALEVDPANVETLTRLGQCLVLDGDVDSAAERLRMARRLNPYEPEIHLWLGHALHERGEMREALLELKSAYQELSSSEAAAVWYADALYSSGQKQAAVQVLEDDLKRHPNHVAGLVTMSRYRLMSASVTDSAIAWQARKDLQLALSRIPLYLPHPTDGSTVAASSVSPPQAIDPMGDLALELRRPEADLKRDIEKLMEEADSRIDGSTLSK